MIIAFYPGAGGNKLFRSLTGQEWQTHRVPYDHLVLGQSTDLRYINENSTVDTGNDFILTHCVNTPLLKRLFPTQTITVINFPLENCLRREWHLSGHDRYLVKLSLMEKQKSILELYQAVKDSSWIEITREDEIEKLPQNILDELRMHLENQRNSKPLETGLARLKQKYHNELESAFEQIKWHKDYYDRYPLDIAYASQTIDLYDCSEFSLHMRSELDLYPSATFNDCWKVLHE